MYRRREKQCQKSTVLTHRSEIQTQQYTAQVYPTVCHWGNSAALRGDITSRFKNKQAKSTPQNKKQDQNQSEVWTCGSASTTSLKVTQWLIHPLNKQNNNQREVGLDLWELLNHPSKHLDNRSIRNIDHCSSIPWSVPGVSA